MLAIKRQRSKLNTVCGSESLNLIKQRVTLLSVAQILRGRVHLVRV